MCCKPGHSQLMVHVFLSQPCDRSPSFWWLPDGVCVLCLFVFISILMPKQTGSLFGCTPSIYRCIPLLFGKFISMLVGVRRSYHVDAHSTRTYFWCTQCVLGFGLCGFGHWCNIWQLLATALLLWHRFQWCAMPNRRCQRIIVIISLFFLFFFPFSLARENGNVDILPCETIYT